MNQQTETLKMALELLAVATFLSPELQKQRSAVIDTGLKTLAEQQEPAALVTSLIVDADGVVRAGLDRELPLMTELYTQPARNPLTDELENAFKDGWNAAKAAYSIKENT